MLGVWQVKESYWFTAAVLRCDWGTSVAKASPQTAERGTGFDNAADVQYTTREYAKTGAFKVDSRIELEVSLTGLREVSEERR